MVKAAATEADKAEDNATDKAAATEAVKAADSEGATADLVINRRVRDLKADSEIHRLRKRLPLRHLLKRLPKLRRKLRQNNICKHQVPI
jgi:hypothetical protein